MKIFFCILFSLPLLHCTPSTPPQPTAKQGVLSLQADAASNRQAWDFKRDGTLTLDGEWELYWNQLLDPIDFNHNTNPKPTAIVRIPDVWKEQNINGVQTSNFGYATYRLRIRFPEKSFLQRQLLALRVHYELTAYRVFYNGIAVATNGNVTTDASHFQAEYRPLTVNLPTEDTDDVEIIVQVANFVHQSGGFITPIKLGLASTLIADTRLKQLTDAFLLGATLLMALYFIMLFLWRPVDKAPLWFALSCFAIITRICVTSERLIFVVIPNFPWDMLLRTTYVSTLVALIAAIFYVKNLLPLDTNRWVIRIITLVSVLLAIPILFLSPLQFTHIVFGVEVITIAALSYMVFVSFLAFVRKRENTFPLFLGFIFIVIAAMNDILYNHLQVGIGYIIPYGVLALILMHSASLLIRLATSFRRAELRKEDLEAEVALRTKRLSEAVHVAENAIQEKSVFFAMMTHELRTPLNGIIGIANLMRQSGLPKEHEKNLSIIQSSGTHLMSVINDILDFSLMEAGKLTLHSTPFSLVEFYAEISQITEVLAQQKKIYFTVKPLPEGLPEKVLADEARLKQALLNVIGNAVKFTAKGFIKISVHWIETRSDTVSLEFVVQDTGVGILDSDLPRLFKPYMQADQKRTRRFGGTGLGLAITASIVEAFGGKIAVQSTKGVGSWFSLQIPLKIAPKEKKPQFPSAVQNESTQKIADSYPLHILVVEDEPVNQIVITESLRLLGYEARVVSSGFEAINLVEKEDFDLILMDIQMPALSGIEATERILQLPERAHCKIIAVTADTSNENRNQCAAAGMVDFLMKPYTLPALREVILKWAKKNHL